MSDESRPEPAAQVPADDARQQTWARHLKFARNRHRRGELESFEQQYDGRGFDPFLIKAAIALITHADIGGWVPPAPTAEQAADLNAWANQVAAEHRRNAQNQKWERQLLGLPPNRGNGRPIGPIWTQQSKVPLDQLAPRLERIMAEHQARHGAFDRKWLDPNSDKHIEGFTNKQIPLMANLIEDKQEQRSLDANWKIIDDFLAKRRASSTDTAVAAEEGGPNANTKHSRIPI